MMGNQGSPNPSFFYYDDFTSFVAMACFAPLAAPSNCARSWCARSARARHMVTEIKWHDFKK